MLELVKAELDAIAPDGGYVVFGSAAMALQGLAVEPGDVDVFMRPWIYERALARSGWREETPQAGDPPMLTWEGGEIPVHAWSRWRVRAWDPIGAREVFARCRLRGGWWVQDLRQLGDWKHALLFREEASDRHAKDEAHLWVLDRSGHWSVLRECGSVRRDVA